MGTLFVVATPIGNLQDFSPRAVETLRAVSLIAAEDTRHSGALRKAYDITTPMVSYHHHNRQARERLLLQALESGDVAVISDAGTPGIADPGREIVAAAHAAGHTVTPIPGPSAAIAAVCASGLVEGPFAFLGFLPRKGEERRAELGRAAAASWPLVIFESPVRTVDTLRDLAEMLGDRPGIVARELTKLHEEVVSGTLPKIADLFATREVRGEIVIVVGGAAVGDGDVSDALSIARRLLGEGLKPSRAARELSVIAGLSGEEAYDIVRRARSD